MALSNISVEEIFSISPNVSKDSSEIRSFLTPITGSDSNIKKWAINKNNIKPPEPESFVLKYISKIENFERIDNVEQVLEIYSQYMERISMSVDQKIQAGKNPVDISENAATQRSMGCAKFKNYMADSGYFSGEVLEESEDSLNFITEVMSLIDHESYKSKDIKPEIGARIISNFVHLAVLDSKKIDRVMQTVKGACPKNVKYQDARDGLLEGAMAEIFTIYSIVNSKVLEEIGYEIKKPSPFNDAYKGEDFIVVDEEGKKILNIDVKKGALACDGSCVLKLDNSGKVRAYRAGIPTDSLIIEYDVQDNVLNNLISDGIPFVVVRVPPEFDCYDSDSGVVVLDRERYNAFGEHLSSEIKYELVERSRRYE